jgi:hypothetical protein
MSTDALTIGIPPDVMADMEAMAAAVSEGRQPDPDLLRRVQERADAARKQILASRGVQNIGVDIIRELRGDLRES